MVSRVRLNVFGGANSIPNLKLARIGKQQGSPRLLRSRQSPRHRQSSFMKNREQNAMLAEAVVARYRAPVAQVICDTD